MLHQHPHHVSRQTTRRLTIDLSHVTTKTSRLLRRVLQEAIQQWFNPHRSDTSSSPIRSPLDIKCISVYKRLLQTLTCSVTFCKETTSTQPQQCTSQWNRIRWKEIFNGRFSKEREGEYYFNHCRHANHRRTGAQWWQHHLITTICWQEWASEGLETAEKHCLGS